jgi:hypothetical protein
LAKENSNHHPKFWTVYERILKNIARTTESLEGYQRHLNGVCDVRNYTILTLVEEFLIEFQFKTKKLILSFKGYWVDSDKNLTE